VLDDLYPGGYLNLADAYRQARRDADGEKTLRTAIARMPRNADFHHALGLLLVRKGDKPAALQSLAQAARLAPDNVRYAYVQAIALNSMGKRTEALALLRATQTRHPNDLDTLNALVSIQAETGDAKGCTGLCREDGRADARRSVGATPSSRSEGSRRTLKVAPPGHG
jgi:predicted Zn-dependent protease